MQSVESPSVEYFSIINRKWGHNSRGKEDTASLYEQVLCHICYNNNNDNNQLEEGINPVNIGRVNSVEDDVVKEIGCLQALADLSEKFASDDKGMTRISHIDTDQARIILGEMGENYWFYTKIKFSKLILDNDEVHYTERGLASPDYLRQKFINGYNLFVLNNGIFDDCVIKYEKQELREFVTAWWKVWLDHTFEFKSAYNFEDDALFKLIPGVRYSCVEKPFGFKENIEKGLKEFVDNCNGLDDILVLNTNWTPEKNWGVVYLNEESIYSKKSLYALINYLKDIDITFGLSTSALTHHNWPSLRQYVEQFNPRDPSVNLIERSLMVPAIYLQTKLANNVFDPIGEALETFESYVPIRGVVNQVTNYVAPSISAVSDFTIKPLYSLASFWAHKNSVDATDVTNATVSESNQLHSSSSRTRNFDKDIIDESLKTEKATGTFILGLKNQHDILIKDLFLESSNGNFKNVKFVIYELNGIMFVLMFNESSMIDSEVFFNELSAKIDHIYETFFSDLIIKQVEDLKDDFTEDPDFIYIIYDNEKYWTTVPNIPPNPDVLECQIPQRKQLLEQNLNINLTKNGETLDTYRAMSLMQFKQLQYIMEDLISNRLHPDLHSDEKLSKIGKNQWCYVKKYSAKKWVLVVKRIDNVEVNNRNYILGEKVHAWLDWVQADGYLC
ncbi:hypothetical protein CANINC_004621 [Pichia inconspicua]|uniref:CCZ1/INTU/HSP4 first Longin domain-containing protein n=1 Tax=Pichia inconspicua TaxID=52247 RepID=A0A4T0WXB0_9ASCO|nr:hypothetical protein CANINC_004621 [[Candida] inconspicua]